MNKKILIIAAHRDDEVLGAGGTIAKHVEEEDKVYCLILGNEILCRESENLNNQAIESSKILGITEIFFENFPDNKFDSIPLLEITQTVEKYVNKIKPNIIYTHWEDDLNIDHRTTFNAVITACRPCTNDSLEKILSFEVLSSSEWRLTKKFKPNVYINIEKTFEKKVRALNAYQSEIRNYPHSRSTKGIEILANYRGLECGKKFVEAFYLVKQIKD
jgi:LmbE family N-acetylglucosaminyl deacetylase